jgi:hypothetical protein
MLDYQRVFVSHLDISTVVLLMLVGHDSRRHPAIGDPAAWTIRTVALIKDSLNRGRW